MRAPILLRAAAATAAVALALIAAGPAVAADGVNVDHVEVADDGTVSVLLAVDGLTAGVTPDLDGIGVTVDGQAVDVVASPIAAGRIERTTVLALDASESMRGAPFAQARAAAKEFIDSAPPDVKIGLLTFSSTVHDVIEPTTDRAELVSAIDAMTLTRGTHVYDAIIEASGLAGTDGARSVLVLSDGKDQGSTATLAEVEKSATEAEVVVDVVALQQAAGDRTLMAGIADSSGGQVIDAADPGSLRAAFAAQADALAGQVLLQFQQPGRAPDEASLEVTVPAGGKTYTDSAYVTLASVSDSGPATVEHSAPLVGTTAFLVGAAALALGLAIVLAVVLVGRRGPSAAEQQLMAYFGTVGKGHKASTTPGIRDSAVAMTGNLVKGSFEARLAQRLVGAGSALTAAEWLLVHSGIAITAAAAGFVVRGPALALLGLAVGALLPWLYLRRKHTKRLAAFDSQLAETLTLMAGGLSAGLSMPQSIDSVVREGSEPMSGELRRALVEARLGVDIEDALESVARRMASDDFAWVVMAIRIQREVGGNLAELLNTVAETLRERAYLRRQVRVLSAEGRMSAWVLGALPFVMFTYMLIVRPDVVRVLWTDPIGLAMAGAAIALMLMGFFALSRIVKIEV
ncbi:MAG TPA: type II secretion system F family protein [Nocardioides sp.]|nr:type II secretion system F family protein [Nocardioides sp.]